MLIYLLYITNFILKKFKNEARTRREMEIAVPWEHRLKMHHIHDKGFNHSG